MEKQQSLQHSEFSDRKVSRSGRLLAFQTFDTDAHMSFGDHVDVVRSITDAQSDCFWSLTQLGPTHDLTIATISCFCLGDTLQQRTTSESSATTLNWVSRGYDIEEFALSA
jgi:hypothetical protein